MSASMSWLSKLSPFSSPPASPIGMKGERPPSLSLGGDRRASDAAIDALLPGEHAGTELFDPLSESSFQTALSSMIETAGVRSPGIDTVSNSQAASNAVALMAGFTGSDVDARLPPMRSKRANAKAALAAAAAVASTSRPASPKNSRPSSGSGRSKNKRGGSVARVSAPKNHGYPNLFNPPDDGTAWATDPTTKPPYAYTCLIYQAIRDHPNDKVLLGDIYDSMMERYAYYRAKDHETAWKNSIRHNLTMHKSFVKVKREDSDPGKGGYWGIDEEIAAQEICFDPKQTNGKSPAGSKRKASGGGTPKAVKMPKAEKSTLPPNQAPASMTSIGKKCGEKPKKSEPPLALNASWLEQLGTTLGASFGGPGAAALKMKMDDPGTLDLSELSQENFDERELLGDLMNESDEDNARQVEGELADQLHPSGSVGVPTSLGASFSGMVGFGGNVIATPISALGTSFSALGFPGLGGSFTNLAGSLGGSIFNWSSTSKTLTQTPAAPDGQKK